MHSAGSGEHVLQDKPSMKSLGYLLVAVVPFASAGVFAAEPTPVVFAHSGQKVTVPAGGEINEGDVLALAAYGKRWGEPATVKGGAAEFVAPEVRAPMAFRLAAATNGKFVGAELLVYPDHWFPWDTDPELRKLKKMQFVAVGAPQWLETWLAAVEFTAETFSGPEALDAHHWRMVEKPGLLMAGRKAAGSNPDETARLAADFTTNVLVVNADWFGARQAAAKPLALRPKPGKGATANVEGKDQYTPSIFQGGAGRFGSPGLAAAARLRQLLGPLARHLEPVDLARRSPVSVGRGDSSSAEGRGNAADGCQLLALARATRSLCRGRRIVPATVDRNGQGERERSTHGGPMVAALSGGQGGQVP